MHDNSTGSILHEDFLFPAGLWIALAATEIGVVSGQLAEVIANREPIDEPLDAKLAAYFNRPVGFFLSLNEEAGRAAWIAERDAP
jgi:plasmid maintenance system antidote protein VapI